MGFGLLVLWEIILLLLGGLIVFGGIKGILTTTVVLSLINFLVGYPAQFWRRENFILLGLGFGLMVLFIISWKARRGSKIQGLSSGIATIVLLGAFVTPVAALVIWILIGGAGLIKKGRKGEVFWGFAPSVWRLLLAIAAIIYGNVLSIQ